MEIVAQKNLDHSVDALENYFMEMDKNGNITEETVSIAEYKTENPKATYDEIAKHFAISTMKVKRLYKKL